MNIAIIVLDCLRADHTSCYGYPRPTTPVLDRFAETAVRFTDNMSAGVWTLPSMTAMMTGLHPSGHGLNRGNARLRSDVVTLAERLRDAGYATGGFSANPYVGRSFGLDRGFTSFKEYWGVGGGATGSGESLLDRSYRWLLPRARHIVKRSQALTRAFMAYQRARTASGHDKGGERLASDAAAWIRAQRAQGRPFFTLLHFMEAHTPLAPPQRVARRFLDDQRLHAARKVDQDGMGYMAGANDLSTHDRELLIDLYDASIAYGDELLAPVLDALSDDDLVIITADHGNHFGDHELMGHFFSVYDTLTHVPLLMRSPGRSGEVVQYPVQSTDIAVTALLAAGLSVDRLPGRSLLQPEQPRPCVVAEYLDPDVSRFSRFRNFNPSPYARELRAVRVGDLKYIWASDGTEQLYNLRDDPGEVDNRAASEPEHLQTLRDAHHLWLQAHDLAPASGGWVPLDPRSGGEAPASPALELEPEVAASLRALGYFDD